MRRVLRLLLCVAVFTVMLLPSLCAAAPDAEKRIDEAVNLCLNRHRDTANLAKSEDILKAVLADEPANVRAEAELARVTYLIGDAAPSKDAKLSRYQKGAEYARSAISHDPRSAWAHFWLAVNLGRIGQTKGVMNSLFMVKEIRTEIETVLTLDPNHADALAVRGVINYEVPGLFGGDMKKSFQDLQKAIELRPTTTRFYVDLGEACIRAKEYARARQNLSTALNMAAPQSEADFTLTDKPRAERLLKQIEKK